jgi:hypothetical protein
VGATRKRLATTIPRQSFLWGQVPGYKPQSHEVRSRLSGDWRYWEWRDRVRELRPREFVRSLEFESSKKNWGIDGKGCQKNVVVEHRLRNRCQPCVEFYWTIEKGCTLWRSNCNCIEVINPVDNPIPRLRSPNAWQYFPSSVKHYIIYIIALHVSAI